MPASYHATQPSKRWPCPAFNPERILVPADIQTLRRFSRNDLFDRVEIEDDRLVPITGSILSDRINRYSRALFMKLTVDLRAVDVDDLDAFSEKRQSLTSHFLSSFVHPKLFDERLEPARPFCRSAWWPPVPRQRPSQRSGYCYEAPRVSSPAQFRSANFLEMEAQIDRVGLGNRGLGAVRSFHGWCTS